MWNVRVGEIQTGTFPAINGFHGVHESPKTAATDNRHFGFPANWKARLEPQNGFVKLRSHFLLRRRAMMKWKIFKVKGYKKVKWFWFLFFSTFLSVCRLNNGVQFHCHSW
jgi:hypothetical protein